MIYTAVITSHLNSGPLKFPRRHRAVTAVERRHSGTLQDACQRRDDDTGNPAKASGLFLRSGASEYTVYRAIINHFRPMPGDWCPKTLSRCLRLQQNKFVMILVVLRLDKRSLHISNYIITVCVIIPISVRNAGGKNEYNPTDSPGTLHGS